MQQSVPDSTAVPTPICIRMNEDGPATRACLSGIVHAHPRYALPGSAATLTQTRQSIATDAPDVRLLDLGLPNGHRIAMTRWLREHGRSPEILVIPIVGDEFTVPPANEAGAGATC
jgi:DNA-binding NarL/FixJ family response regulator